MHEVDAAVQGQNVIGRDDVGGLSTAYVFGTPPKAQGSLCVEKLSLQDFFIQTVKGNGGRIK